MFETPEENEIEDVLYLHSFHTMLREFTAKCIRKDFEYLKNANYMQSLIKALSKLIFFVTNVEGEKDPYYCEGLPHKFR